MSAYGVEYPVDADGVRMQTFEPSATGRAELIRLGAKLTIGCPRCGRPIAWIFDPPHPNSDGPVDTLIASARTEDVRFVKAGDYPAP